MSSSFSLFLVFLSLLVACFYLFRLLIGRLWLHAFDAENEVGHGMMAMAMACMLAPVGFLTPETIRWNLVLCVLALLWFLGRLFTQKPLLVLFLRTSGRSSSVQGDTLHVVMYGGMGVMFLLMSRITLLLAPLAIYATCLFFVFFAFLTFFYGRATFRDVQPSKVNWLQGGANLAHTLMSGIMCWMFLGMLTLPIRA